MAALLQMTSLQFLSRPGKPRRELGIISYKKKLLGPMQLEVRFALIQHSPQPHTCRLCTQVVMPRVRKDGACAQFRPSQPEESMIQLYKVC